MTVAEDATTMEEVQAVVLVVEKVLLQEANAAQAAEVSEAQLHDKADFHLTEVHETKVSEDLKAEAKAHVGKADILKAHQEDQIRHVAKAVFRNALQEGLNRPAMRREQDAQGKAKKIC